jgi:C4-dicarboxylate-specific signal transduction histidine kinase
MAGMAEIATGVLHNVGNVLNSLNVSVSLVGDHVKASRVGSLTKSVELFEKYPGGLPAFLATEKGKVLPGYLTSVSKKLVEENTQVLGELKSITRNVDHIKAIVQMQQTYARPSGVLEPVRVHELVDDALRMGESSFAKHGIEVVKDYGDGATIVTDRHRVLQILINLISNARHALKDHSTAVQRLVVQVRRTATGVTLAVIDTGVGIPAENLDRIFVHGFTTKQEGHGFGLHASANAARELGGTLTAASAGPGKGATFTLELPNGARDAIN